MIRNENTNSLIDRLERLDLTTEISTVAHVTVTFIPEAGKARYTTKKKGGD